MAAAQVRDVKGTIKKAQSGDSKAQLNLGVMFEDR